MTRLSRRSFSVGACAGTLAFAPQARAQIANDPYPYPQIGGSAPLFTAPKFGGGQASLADYRGRTLVPAFGGLWCPDCVVEEQELNQLARSIADDPRLAFLALHSGDSYGRWGPRDPSVIAAAGAITAYRLAMNVAYPLAFDLDFAIAHAYGIEWFPTILIIDRGGVMRASTSDLRRRTVPTFLAQIRTVAGH